MEAFSVIHTLSSNYNLIEKPKIINPEIEDILVLLRFDKEGKISSSDVRVNHTINVACNLNRPELLELRSLIVNDFINRINEHYFFYKKEKSNISRFIPDIKNFKDNCTNKKTFYSFRYFILNNIDVFFSAPPLRKILKGLIPKC